MIHAQITKHSIFLFSGLSYIACLKKDDNMKIRFNSNLNEFCIENGNNTIWVKKYEIDF